MLTLGIETSCDETAASIVRDGQEVLSNAVYSQVALHRPYGGVVPELAARLHIEALPKILEECKNIRNTTHTDGLSVGDAVITTAGDLKAKYIIHTVGPQYRSDPNPEQSLIACYKSSLLLADKHQCASIAFPAIATGIYGYPIEKASKIAYETVSKLFEECQFIKDVVFVFFSQKDKNVFCSINSLDCN